MFSYLFRSNFSVIFKNNIGGLLAAVLVTLGWIFKMPFASKQVEEIADAEIKWASLGLQLISEFFYHTSFILICLPITVYEALTIILSFFWSPKLVERLLIVWTIFFFVSGVALYIYRHEMGRWYIFELRFCLGWSILTLMVKKTRAFNQKRLIYSILTAIGLLWSYACSVNGMMYPLVFLFCGSSMVTKFEWKSSSDFKTKKNMIIEGIFFGPLLQQFCMIVAGCYILMRSI